MRFYRSIRWQYPVGLELMLQQGPRSDLYGAVLQVDDLASLQVLLCRLAQKRSKLSGLKQERNVHGHA